MQTREWAMLADAIRKEFEPSGYHVYVNSNSGVIEVTEVNRAPNTPQEKFSIKLERR